MDELIAAKMRILQTIRIAKRTDQLLIVELQREALELIDRQIKKRPDATNVKPRRPFQ